jgi:ATP-dependent Lhr-like helicase
MFSVLLPEGEEQPGARRVGELDEEMVYESRVNDIITLGQPPGASSKSPMTR